MLTIPAPAKLTIFLGSAPLVELPLVLLLVVPLEAVEVPAVLVRTPVGATEPALVLEPATVLEPVVLEPVPALEPVGVVELPTGVLLFVAVSR
jgi:hypothetical protein